MNRLRGFLVIGLLGLLLVFCGQFLWRKTPEVTSLSKSQTSEFGTVEDRGLIPNSKVFNQAFDSLHGMALVSGTLQLNQFVQMQLNCVGGMGRYHVAICGAKGHQEPSMRPIDLAIVTNQKTYPLQGELWHGESNQLGMAVEFDLNTEQLQAVANAKSVTFDLGDHDMTTLTPANQEELRALLAFTAK